MTNILTLQNLQYKNILDSITFSLEEKTFNILVGPNGSGKTTIVNAMRQMLEYSGDIFVFNQNIKNNLDISKKIGFFIRENYLLENNVYDELLSFLINIDYEKEEAKKRIYAVTKKIGITNILFKKQKDLRNYEKTLLSFLFSIIHEPKILIIDNELETLDENYKNKILSYIKGKKKLTVLFITNNANYFYLADKFLFLKEGKIVSSCNSDEIVENEKLFVKLGASLPFSIELSNKLISYELLDNIETNIEEMVSKIWK